MRYWYLYHGMCVCALWSSYHSMRTCCRRQNHTRKHVVELQKMKKRRRRAKRFAFDKMRDCGVADKKRIFNGCYSSCVRVFTPTAIQMSSNRHQLFCAGRRGDRRHCLRCVCSKVLLGIRTTVTYLTTDYTPFNLPTITLAQL